MSSGTEMRNYLFPDSPLSDTDSSDEQEHSEMMARLELIEEDDPYTDKLSDLGLDIDDNESRILLAKRKKQVVNARKRVVVIPKPAFMKVLHEGGWQLALLYIYLLLNITKTGLIKTNMRMLSEWLNIKRYKQRTIQEMLSKLANTKVANVSKINQYGVTYNLNTTLEIQLNKLQYPGTFFYILLENLEMIRKYGGYREFVLYCRMEAATFGNHEDRNILLPDRRCMISQESLAKDLHISIGTVAKSIRNLDEWKYLYITKKFDVTEKRYFCSTYTLLNHNSYYRASFLSKRKEAEALKKEREAVMQSDNVEQKRFWEALDKFLSIKQESLPAIIQGGCAEQIWDYGSSIQSMSRFYFDSNLLRIGCEFDAYHPKGRIRVMAIDYWNDKWQERIKFMDKHYPDKNHIILLFHLPFRHRDEYFYGYSLHRFDM